MTDEFHANSYVLEFAGFRAHKRDTKSLTFLLKVAPPHLFLWRIVVRIYRRDFRKSFQLGFGTPHFQHMMQPILKHHHLLPYPVSEVARIGL